MTTFVLEILEGDRAGEVIPLTDAPLTIGRRAGNALVFKDEKLSGEHAEIVFEGGRHVLRDRESTNGTLLDGKKVTEVALTPGDVMQLGRVRILYRSQDGAGGAADLQVRRLDQGALKKLGRRSSTAGLAAVLVLAAGVGGFLLWRSGPQGSGGRSQAAKRQVLRIEGNRLPDAIAGCEDEAAWELGAAGAAFTLGSAAHSGAGALEAEAARVEGQPAAGFALARSKDLVQARAGEAVRLSCWLRASGGGLGAVRLRFTSASDAGIPAVVTGTALTGGEDYQEVAAELRMPPGFDRMQVEVLALLPAEGDSVRVDDLGVVAGGSAQPLDATVAGVSLSGAGGSCVLLGVQGPLLAGLRPRAATAAYAPLLEAKVLELSDLGVSLRAEPDADGVRLVLSPSDQLAGLELLLPSGAYPGGVLQRRAGSAFQPLAGRSTSDELLLCGPTRLGVQAPEPLPIEPLDQGQRVLVGQLPAERTLRFQFAHGKERQQARELLRQAKAEQKGRPGQGLDALARLLGQFPHDDEATREAQQLRALLLADLGLRVEELRAEVRKAQFFASRNGLRRVERALRELVERWGEPNLPQPEVVAALRGTIEQEASKLDQARAAEERSNLEAAAGVFEKYGQSLVAQILRDHLKRD
jgi:hypothetical protein